MQWLAWLRPPRRLLVLFLVVTLAPAAGLVWLGWRLLGQERALEAQRRLERREQDADRIVGALRERVLLSRQGLADPSRTFDPGAGDAVLVAFSSESARVDPPGGLLYDPSGESSRPATPEPQRRAFLAGERYEFQAKDYAAAAREFERLAQSRDPAVRAGAYVRLARNLRKAGHAEQALATYARLAELDDARLDGVPAGLVARRARCSLLADLGRTRELQREAAALQADLVRGRWRLSRPVFELHVGQLASWLDTTTGGEDGRQALSATAEWLWREWQEARTSGRRVPETSTHAAHGRTVTVLARAEGDALRALLAGPESVRERWIEPVSRTLETHRVALCLRDGSGDVVLGVEPSAASPRTLRAATDTGLPWTVIVTDAGPSAQDASFTSRRRLLLSGLALGAILVVAGSTLVARAVSRELAVARLKSDFVSAVSHEFRTPLATLRQLTENLSDGRVEDEGRRQAYFQAQARATSRLSRLVERLLDFGRMEAGALRYRPELLDLGKLVRSVVDEFEHVVADTGHRIEMTIDPEVPPVRADGEALAQAVWNLLDNAIKYSPGRPAVWIEVTEEDGQAAVRVRDEGPGIHPEERKDLFREFTRGAAARAGNVKGTGIGLAMVHHIVRAHRGRIRVDSAPGRGSTFTILLKTEPA
jgi:signal transduction histidine kinase/tetratricopeptide (TPR) repeat protein